MIKPNYIDTDDSLPKNHPQLVLFTDCVMNSTMREKNETVTSFKTKELKNCTKSMVAELHTQTVNYRSNLTQPNLTSPIPRCTTVQM